jgi:tripartite-type tricarboxylate transporter receptor subunit TctC
MMKLVFRAVMIAGALCWSIAAWPQAGEAWPSKPVKFVVPVAGGGADILSRMFGEKLRQVLGQPFIVENKPGANGMIATEYVARSPADGHTLLFSFTAAHLVTPTLYPKVSYDPIKDFIPVAQIGSGGNLLLVPAGTPVRTVKEFIEYVRARPGQLSYGSWGNGSGGHLAMESLLKQTGLKMQHVPYKSNVASVADLLAGHIQVAFADMQSTVPHIRSGKLRVIAQNSKKRAVTMPDVPTLNEEGIKWDLDAWFGVFAPAGTPLSIVNRLNQEINKVLASDDMSERFRQVNLHDRTPKSVQDFTETVRRDYVEWGNLVRENNIKVE